MTKPNLWDDLDTVIKLRQEKRKLEEAQAHQIAYMHGLIDRLEHANDDLERWRLRVLEIDAQLNGRKGGGDAS